MPSFADSIFLFVLALLLFGPKKLPVLARELGKWMGEFRRASNEFKMQMEDELRASEQAERQKQIAAMEAAAPIPPALDEPAEPEHPHLRGHTPADPAEPSPAGPEDPLSLNSASETAPPDRVDETSVAGTAAPPQADPANETRPVPIATSGSLRMMPPSTGLPSPRSKGNNALSGLVESIPETGSESGTALSPASATPATEEVAHAD